MDSESLSKAPREVTLGGKTYLVSKLVRREWNELQAWLRDHTTDPVVAALGQLAKAKAAGIEVSAEDRKELCEAARREAKTWPPPVGSAEWLDLLVGDEASLKFIALVLRKHQPGVTDAEVEDANDRATGDESRALIYRAMGWEPPPKAEPPAAPGGETPAPATGPTTPGPASSPP